MPRETVDEKALRYIQERRLHVTHVAPRTVEAHCDGDTGTYTVRYDGRRWRCDCPAHRRCSHLTALQLVADPPVPQRHPDAHAHRRFHAARTQDDTPSPPRRDTWETAAGRYVIDTCPRCGNQGRVAKTDGLCPACTTSPVTTQ